MKILKYIKLFENYNQIKESKKHTPQKSPVSGKSAPKFGSVELDWKSEIDEALYIVLKAEEKSKSEPQLLKWLSDLGYTKSEMKSEGEKIKDFIKKETMKIAKEKKIKNAFGPEMKGTVIKVPVIALDPKSKS